MDTNALKKFAQAARNLLIDQVASKLDVVLAEGGAARREAPKAVKDLENAITKADKQQVIEQVAYTWFNRFTALRFMDANGYTQVRTVSPADGGHTARAFVRGDGGQPAGRCACHHPIPPRRGARRPMTHRLRLIASCSSTPAICGTAPCRSCSNRSTTTPNC